MSLKLITPPNDTPVSLEDAKAHLRVDHAAQDVYIQFLLQAATDHAEKVTGRALKPQSWEFVSSDFPCGSIQIPKPPLISIESINYVNDAGLEQVIDESNYEVNFVSSPGLIVPKANFLWPATRETQDAVRIRFTAGYPDQAASESESEAAVVSTVPAPIKLAILMMVEDLYKNRGNTTTGQVSEVPMPSSSDNLLQTFKVYL